MRCCFFCCWKIHDTFHIYLAKLIAMMFFLANSSSPCRPPIKDRTPEPEPPRKSMCVTKKQPRNKCSVKEFLQFFFSLFHCFGCIHTPHCPPAAGHLPVPSLSGRAVFVCRFVFIPSTRLMPFAWNGKHIQTEASQERNAVPIPPMPEQIDSTGS